MRKIFLSKNKKILFILSLLLLLLVNCAHNRKKVKIYNEKFVNFLYNSIEDHFDFDDQFYLIGKNPRILKNKIISKEQAEKQIKLFIKKIGIDFKNLRWGKIKKYKNMFYIANKEGYKFAVFCCFLNKKKIYYFCPK